MGWEQRTIAICLVLIVLLVIWQTLGIYGVVDGGIAAWVLKWQTLFSSLAAATLAILGIGWQISVARRRDEESRRAAEQRWQAEAEEALERDRQARIEALRQMGYAVARDLGRIIARANDFGRLQGMVGSTDDADILGEVRSFSWTTDNLNHWAPTLGNFGPIARDLYKVADAYEPLRREVELLALGSKASANDQEVVFRLFSEQNKKLARRCRIDARAAQQKLDKLLSADLPGEFNEGSPSTQEAGDLISNFVLQALAPTRKFNELLQATLRSFSWGTKPRE